MSAKRWRPVRALGMVTAVGAATLSFGAAEAAAEPEVEGGFVTYTTTSGNQVTCGYSAMHARRDDPSNPYFVTFASSTYWTSDEAAPCPGADLYARLEFTTTDGRSTSGEASTTADTQAFATAGGAIANTSGIHSTHRWTFRSCDLARSPGGCSRSLTLDSPAPSAK